MNWRLLALILCFFSLELLAAPRLTEVSSEAQLTPFYKQLAGRNQSSDDNFYTIEHDYSSSRRDEIDGMLDPANDGLPGLFSDPLSLRRISQNLYNVQTTLNILVETLELRNKLLYSSSRKGNTTVHNYHFKEFNRFFSESKIQVTVKEGRNGSEVSLRQICGVKNSANNTLKKIPFGSSTLKKKMLNNIKQFEKGTSGK